jgi:serine/threonine protein kinase
MHLSRAKRVNFLTKNLSKITCLDKYNEKKIIASGTIGTVYLTCKSKTHACHAAKLQILNNEQEELFFNNEIKSQIAFYPKAPKIYTYCVDDIKNYRVGTIVMELTAGELDEELNTRKTKTELNEIIQDVAELLAFAASKKYVHGDLALFNISFVNRKQKKEMIFIDFDRSSTKEFSSFKKLDSLRIISELYEQSRSANTKKLHGFNIEYLVTNAIPVWKQFGKLTLKEINPKNIDDVWMNLFCKYCFKAKVLCLDNDACKKLSIDDVHDAPKIISKIKKKPEIQNQIITRMKLRKRDL